MSTLRVLVVGPSIDRTRGGMTAVINSIISYKGKKQSIELNHAVTHVEGYTIEKFIVAFRALLSALLLKYDIMHIHVASDISIFRKSLFVYIGNILKRPVILHIHGGDFDEYYYNSSPIVKRYIKKTLLKCHKIIVLSEYYKIFFELLVPTCNIEVVHNGVGVTELKTCQTAPLNRTNFLFLGKLCKAKGIYDLLDAVDTLVNKRNQKHLKFFIAGDGEMGKVKNVISQKGLEMNVHLLGWLNHDQKLKWLSQTDTVILPSYIEALPMSIIEAMAAGKIIISSKIGGIPELVKEENGFLIVPGAIDDLCKHIQNVSSNAEQLIEISNNNIKKISEQYDIDKITDRIFEIYDEVTKQDRSWEAANILTV